MICLKRYKDDRNKSAVPHKFNYNTTIRYLSCGKAFKIWNHWLKVNGEMKTSDIYNDNDARRRLDAMT